MFATAPVVRQVFDLVPAYGPRRLLARTASRIVDAWIGHSEANGEAEASSKALSPSSAAPPQPEIVFIVGFWRSGTTLLHELLALDPAAAAPTLVDCLMPGHIHRFRKARRRILGRLLPGDRGVDPQTLGADRPMEEDLAIAQMGGPSAFLAFYFPSRRAALLREALFFEGGRPDAPALWKRSHENFVAALARQYPGQRLILKSPANSTRLAHLQEMYPQARFVRIDRRPEQVCASLKRLMDQGTLSLEGAPRPVSPHEIASLHQDFMSALDRGWQAIASERKASIRFEELVASPIETVDRISAALGIALRPRQRARLAAYCRDITRPAAPPYQTVARAEPARPVFGSPMPRPASPIFLTAPEPR
jgi:hypothetical protein